MRSPATSQPGCRKASSKRASASPTTSPARTKAPSAVSRFTSSNTQALAATFSIDSAREGIGDRNIMQTSDTGETAIASPFGQMHLIYTPKGQEKSGSKKEIKANWAADANMKREKAKDPHAHPVLGRYHGFSATSVTVVELEKIIQSLKPLGR